MHVRQQKSSGVVKYFDTTMAVTVAFPLLLVSPTGDLQDLAINSFGRCVRTRLYFTSESHIQVSASCRFVMYITYFPLTLH
jgi:hypothetical protein